MKTKYHIKQSTEEWRQSSVPTSGFEGWGRQGRRAFATAILSIVSAACSKPTTRGEISEADAKNPEVRKGVVAMTRKGLAEYVVALIQAGKGPLESLPPGGSAIKEFALELPMDPSIFSPPIKRNEITDGIEADIATLMNERKPLEGDIWSLSVAFKPWAYDPVSKKTALPVQLIVHKGGEAPPNPSPKSVTA